MEGKLVISSSPHIRVPETIRGMMTDVLIALFPAALASVILFGYRALAIIVISVLTSMVTEAIILRKINVYGDGSAAVTGLLLAFTLPPTLPWWIVVIGSVVAISIGKQVYGGIGNNLFNPALVSRAVLTLSWPAYLSGDVWANPDLFVFTADLPAITSATPLAAQELPMLFDLFLGNINGSLGETSALALLLGSFWLFYRGHIDWRIPFSFIGVVFAMGVLLGGDLYYDLFSTGLFHIFAGGVMLGALFMATDPVTSPVTPLGRVVFGAGSGLITMLIRLYGGFPEGVTFGILLMNGLTPIIDNLTVPRKFGEARK